MCDIVKEIYIDREPDKGSNFTFTICRVVHNRIELHGQEKMDKKEQLIDAVLKSAKGQHQPDGRKQLTCDEAFELAKKYEAEIIEIGRICNQHNIRICKCQLGCFA
jgi:hypothetical protein